MRARVDTAAVGNQGRGAHRIYASRRQRRRWPAMARTEEDDGGGIARERGEERAGARGSERRVARPV